MANSFSGGGPPSFGGPRRPYHPSAHAARALRKNDRIRAPEVRVIGPDGRQVGILQTRDAVRMAVGLGLDLVEVSPGTRPPVCKILNYGKYMYDEGKKQKGHKVHTSRMKEVKIRPRIEHHDYITKLRHAEEFLFEGHKVKLTLFFKGREMEHTELGFETVKKTLADLLHVGTADQHPRLMGRNISLTMSPLPPNKRKLKFNLREGEVSPQAPTGHEHEHEHEHGHDHSHEHGHDHGHTPSPSPGHTASPARPPAAAEGTRPAPARPAAATPAGAVTSLAAALARAQVSAVPPAAPAAGA